jgi:PKD repeat protein
MIGLFVVGVRVQEYRNGILVGQNVRDFLFRVFNCNITLQAILPIQEDLSTFVSYCQGLTVQFENNSYGGSNYAWDFGVSGTNNDLSSSFAPTFTYPTSGTYTARLIVNPGQPCTDTAYIELIVNNPFSLSWTSQDSLCITGNSFDFIGQTNNPNANFARPNGRRGAAIVAE